MTEQWHVKEAMEAWSWVFDDNGKLVATAYLGYENLIAEAPNLLAACEAVDRASSEFATRFRGFPLDDDDLTGGVSGSVNIDVEVWKVVRRAIAAVRGGK